MPSCRPTLVWGMVNSNNGRNFASFGNNTCVCASGNSTANSSFLATANAWAHYAVVIDSGGAFTFYKNGAGTPGQSLAGSATTIVSTTATARIGVRTSAAFFSGVLDDFRIYQGALSPAQVALLATP